MPVSDVFRDSGNFGDDAIVQRIKAMVTEVFSSTDLNLKANIRRDQLGPLIKAAIWSSHFKSEVGLSLVKFLLEFSVSTGAEGRKDLREVLKAAHGTMDGGIEQSKLSRMFGRSA